MCGGGNPRFVLLADDEPNIGEGGVDQRTAGVRGRVIIQEVGAVVLLRAHGLHEFGTV